MDLPDCWKLSFTVVFLRVFCDLESRSQNKLCHKTDSIPRKLKPTHGIPKDRFSPILVEIEHLKKKTIHPIQIHHIPSLFGEDMDVSENNSTSKSSILIGFSIINHPFWGYPYFWNPSYLPCFGCFESPSFCWSYPLGLAAKARAFELGAKTLVPGGAERRVLCRWLMTKLYFAQVDEKAQKNLLEGV